jgi:hypothetical protein
VALVTLARPSHVDYSLYEGGRAHKFIGGESRVVPESVARICSAMNSDANTPLFVIDWAETDDQDGIQERLY